MIVNIEGKEYEFYVGDTIVTDYGQHLLVVDGSDFNLKDYEHEANFLLIDVKYGTIEGYEQDFYEIPDNYNIVDIVPNEKSFARMEWKDHHGLSKKRLNMS